MQELKLEGKHKTLFDSLESASKQILEGTTLEQPKVDYGQLSIVPRKTLNLTQEVVKHPQMERTCFKRPIAAVAKYNRPRATPSFKKHPEKWTKYSLADVDTSERTNATAAFQFLATIESQKQLDAEKEEAMQTDDAGKIVFRKHIPFKQSQAIKSALDDDTQEDKGGTLKGSKTVMPEYVIGQKQVKEKRVKPKSGGSQKGPQLKLDHLLEEEDE